MAHEIDLSNPEKENSGRIFTYQKKSWHGLDNLFDTPQPSEVVIKAANLDFLVEKRPAMYQTKDGSYKAGDGFYNVRTDTDQSLGLVKKKYTILQNKDAFNFFDEVLTANNVIYETAGSLKGGRKVFVTAKLPKSFSLGKDEDYELYMVLVNSHDGESGVQVFWTSQRVVCMNTLSMAVSGVTVNRERKKRCNYFSVRHTENMNEKMKDVEAIYQKIMSEQIKNAQFLAQATKVPVNDLTIKKLALEMLSYSTELDKNFIANGTQKDLDNLLADVKEQKRKRYESLLTSYYEPNSQQRIIGSAYGFMQGLTYDTSHKLQDEVDEGISSTLFGIGSKMQSKMVSAVEHLMLDY